jgi:hypothetical protein
MVWQPIKSVDCKRPQKITYGWTKVESGGLENAVGICRGAGGLGLH